MSITYSAERILVCKFVAGFIEKQKKLKNHTSQTFDMRIDNNFLENINWDILEKIVTQNGLIAIFEFMLGNDCLPDQTREKWKRYCVQTVFNYILAKKALYKFFEIMDAENIPAVVMRGMALTQWLYSDPVLRPMSDVDILIPRGMRHDFISKVKPHGMVCLHVLRSQFIYDIEHTKFEVHWSFLTPRRYRSIADFDDWINNRQAIKGKQGTIYCFSAENELLDLVCHAFIHHELDTLLKLIDISLVSSDENLDWNYIGDWCKKSSMTRQFSLSLGTIDYILDLNLLDNFPEKNSLPVQPEKIYQAYAAIFFQTDTLIHFFHRKRALLFAAENTVTKLKQLLRFISLDQLSELVNVMKFQFFKSKS